MSSTETLQAIAVATGDTNSAVASAAYTISSSLPSVSTPTFSPAAGTYTSAQSVSISDATSGATIYYTTNGTTPTTSSTEYTGPITVSSTETLQAIAVATGDSAVASAAYTITSPQPNFLLAVSSPSLTVNSGGQGSVTLTVTPENGFDSPVILGVLRAADLGHMHLRPGDGDTLGRSGDDPTHHLHQRAIFCLAAGIPTILPVHSAGYDGLLLRMEKAALLASLAAAGGSLRRPGASLWLRRGPAEVAGRHPPPATSNYFDGDRNGNLRNPTGKGDNRAHGQLGP